MLMPIFLILGCGGTKESAQSSETAAPASEAVAGEPAAQETPTPAAGEEENPIVKRSLDKDPGPANEIAVMKTNMGTITLRLYPKLAPKTVANFKGLAAKGYYDGITFHRVIEGFMIQGGDPTGTGFQGESLWGGKFEDEFAPSLRFDRAGLLAMANAGPNTNGSQFFITQAPTPHLNDKHTIFGEVMEGMDVVNAIAAVRTDERSKPVKPVVIESLTIETQGD
jgi:cyclophilin family peptidyl-prolyl cis-trans isomerase